MKKIQYIIIICTLTLLVSCEEFLDRPPLYEIGNESYWLTKEDLKNYMLHFYNEFEGHEGNLQGLVAYDDEESDNLYVQTPNRVLDGTVTVTSAGWSKDWENVRSVNIFFDNYQKCEDSFESYKHFLGEAHFIRAWYYFKLVKKYGDVPWYNESLNPEKGELLMKARDPRTLVADSIIADLNKAIEYLNTRKTADGGNSRINKEAALAFKTRVALYEGTWQKYHNGTEFATPGANPSKYFQACVDAAEELINGDYTVGIYKTGKPDKDYYNLFGKDDMTFTNEVLFYKAYNAGDGLGHNANHWATISPGEMGLTWSMVTSYLGKDGKSYDYLGLAQTTKGNDFLSTIAADCDPRLHATIWIPGDVMISSSGLKFEKPPVDKAGFDLCISGFQFKKYSNPSSDNGTANRAETGYIILRYGEVLLNYAEAKYELDGTVAYDQLNLLRARAGMPDFTVNPQSDDLNPVDYGYAIPDELYEIRRERRVETVLEEQRKDDWKRWAAHALFKGKRPKGYPFEASEFSKFSPDLDENGLIDAYKNTIPNGYGFKTNRNYLSDIPQAEITLNPNLIQNPGWSD